MRKSKRFITMPVISLEDGQQVGYVKELVVNPAKMEIAGLVVEQKGWFKEQKIVPYNKVRSIGGDAITIEKSSNVEKPANLPEIIDLIKDKTLIIGAKVITESGAFLGYVDEFNIDETSGKIANLEITGNLLNSVIKGHVILGTALIRTLGKDLLIAHEKASEYLKKADGGLQDTIHNLKETTSNILETTLVKTKELGKNIRDYAKSAGKSNKKETLNTSSDETYYEEQPLQATEEEPVIVNTDVPEEDNNTPETKEKHG